MVIWFVYRTYIDGNFFSYRWYVYGILLSYRISYCISDSYVYGITFVYLSIIDRISFEHRVNENVNGTVPARSYAEVLRIDGDRSDLIPTEVRSLSPQ